jgi:hypothetical protein
VHSTYSLRATVTSLRGRQLYDVTASQTKCEMEAVSVGSGA